MAEPDFSQDMAVIGKQYPALTPYLGNAKIQYGQVPAGDPRQLEFYPPWESENPNPGTTTIEIYNRGLAGEPLQRAIALLRKGQ